MKSKFLKFFVLLIVVSNISCKTNLILLNPKKYKDIRMIDSIMESGNLNLALKSYKKLSQYDKKNKELNYKIATIFALKKNKNKAFKYINKEIKKDSTMWILEEPYFYNLTNDKRWNKIEEDQLNKTEFKNGKFKNRELAKITYRMFMKDQSNYYEIEHFSNKQYYYDLKNKLNEENLSELDKMIEEFGWPTISKVGIELSNTAFLIVQHQEDLEKQKKYLILLEKALKENDIKKWNYAYLKDRVLIRENKKQIYGTQLSFDNEKKTFYFDVSSLENPQNIDELRKKIDMETISEYLKNQNIIWDEKKNRLYPNN